MANNSSETRKIIVATQSIRAIVMVDGKAYEEKFDVDLAIWWRVDKNGKAHLRASAHATNEDGDSTLIASPCPTLDPSFFDQTAAVEEPKILVEKNEDCGGQEGEEASVDYDNELEVRKLVKGDSPIV